MSLNSKALMFTISPDQLTRLAQGLPVALLTVTKPTIEPPFKGYIYCKKGKAKDILFLAETRNGERLWEGDDYIANGMVNAEFTCEHIFRYNWSRYGYDFKRAPEFGLDVLDVKQFGESRTKNMYYGGRPIYRITMSAIKIFDKALPLSAFTVAKAAVDCGYGNYNIYDKVLTNPPKPWCYVKERIV